MVKKPFLILSFLSIICMSFSVFAQEIVLTFYSGKEIVIYTPDYNLILFENLNVGDTIPPGSVIETGLRSSCELKLMPGGTMIKLDDKTTFKIEALHESGRNGSHTFKLVRGTFRAVTIQKAGLETYLFKAGLSSCTAASADFCMTVSRGREESVYVLKGECFFSNNLGETITVKEGQMADRYAPQFTVDPISERYRFLADRLIFMTNVSEKKDSVQKSELLLSPAWEDTSDIEYEETPAPTSLPTPEKVVEATPPPYEESEEEIEESKAEESKGGETGPEEKSSKESMVSPEISSAKRFYDNASYGIRVSPAEREILLINEVTTDTLVVTATGTGEDSEYTLFEVYAVYEKSEQIGDQQVFSGFIDTVYLARIEEEKLIFSYTWEGAGKNMKEGYILYPTGRTYTLEGGEIIAEPETEQIEEEAAVTPESPNPAEKKPATTSGPPPLFNIGMGLSISMGFFDTSSWGEFSAEIAFWMAILSMRGNFFIDAILNFLPFMGIGVEAGCGFMTMEIEDYDIQALFLDVPVRGFLRIGAFDTFIQLYGGYYFCAIGSELDGLDMGVKLSVGGFFIEGSYIVMDMSDFFGPTSYFRACIGGSFNGILGK